MSFGRLIADAIAQAIVAAVVFGLVVGGLVVGVGLWLWAHIGMTWPWYWKP